MFDGGKYIESGVIRFKNFRDAVVMCRGLITQNGGIEYLVVEDTYFSKNIVTLKKIVTYSAIMKVLSAVYCRDVKMRDVSPQSWQSKQLGASSKMDRKERKRLSILRAGEMSGKELLDDEADAINMGEYFVNYGSYYADDSKRKKRKKGTRKKAS